MTLEHGENPLGINWDEVLEEIVSSLPPSEVAFSKPISEENPQLPENNIGLNLMEQFIRDKLPNGALQRLKSHQIDIRNFGAYTKDEFYIWQKERLTYYRMSQMSNEEEATASLTLQGMAKFAKNKFEDYARQSGRASPNSSEQAILHEMASNWSWIEQVMNEACDQDKKNPPNP